MLRLIKTEKLEKYKYKADCCVPLTEWQQGWNDAINAILSETPIIDFEPVVRCKDCKFAHMTYDGECKYCDVWEAEGQMYLDGDFYCAFGKRRKDD